MATGATDHKALMQQALDLTKQSPPKPTNFRVGALVVDYSSNEVLATGYTLELPGNTHAEQCCFMKLAEKHRVPEESLSEVLPSTLALYTTMEPCSFRLSGNLPCVQRVLRLASCIKKVYVGVQEPNKFVSDNTGEKSLADAGIEVIHVGGLEKEILEVATEGHEKA
ncbi:cytidine deaminase-like protein [Coniochaeta ligniaria NRRL 30616]|uniref:Cytidine deaminase-like protein n=1 Tax=Coniochaeta ligniaria NRRL 30616 TaxID=1408157 RepID=A0A1J7ICX0_9PEZI|nr:cytidine deaminase-like protein [Coniochaeta ligniaria NRRL 30616]